MDGPNAGGLPIPSGRRSGDVNDAERCMPTIGQEDDALYVVVISNFS